MNKRLLGCLLLLFAAACSGSGERERIPADTPGYVNGKAVHPTIKIGKPYRVQGETFTPKYEPEYEEVGMASWYGPGFDGKSTANGEKFNQYAATGAHRTLPMPSMVQVTNLKNNKTITVRINDRGPFSDDRIIDLSKAAAEELGMMGDGVAKVKVTYDPKLTEAYIAKLQLEKPSAWAEEDMRRAQEEVLTASNADFAAPIETVSSQSLPPMIEATDLPELSDTSAETTVHARGVEMEEIGYAEDAFSVLEKEVYERGGGVTYPPPQEASEVPSDSSFQRVIYQPTRIADPPNGSHGQFFVQVGSFGSEENARTLGNKLSSLAAVDVDPIQMGTTTLHRVRLGPLSSIAIAEELQQRVAEFGIRDARIIQDSGGDL